MFLSRLETTLKKNLHGFWSFQRQSFNLQLKNSVEYCIFSWNFPFTFKIFIKLILFSRWYDIIPPPKTLWRKHETCEIFQHKFALDQPPILWRFLRFIWRAKKKFNLSRHSLSIAIDWIPNSGVSRHASFKRYFLAAASFPLRVSVIESIQVLCGTLAIQRLSGIFSRSLCLINGKIPKNLATLCCIPTAIALPPW